MALTRRRQVFCVDGFWTNSELRQFPGLVWPMDHPDSSNPRDSWKNTNWSRLGHFFPEAPVLRAPLKQKWLPKMVTQTEKVILEYDQLLRLYVIWGTLRTCASMLGGPCLYSHLFEKFISHFRWFWWKINLCPFSKMPNENRKDLCGLTFNWLGTPRGMLWLIYRVYTQDATQDDLGRHVNMSGSTSLNRRRCRSLFLSTTGLFGRGCFCSH